MMMRKLLMAGCLALVLCLCLALPCLAETYDPISASGSSNPKGIASPTGVTVTITVTNGADAEFTSNLELKDENGGAISGFGDGGSASVNAGKTFKDSFSWKVTSAQLAAGKMNFLLRYQVLEITEAEDADGNTAETQEKRTKTRTISVPISKTAATASSSGSASGKLTLEYGVAPASASKGQTVTVTYTLTNGGKNDVSNVQIKNSNLTDKPINIASIPAGETETRTFNYTMGSKAVSAKPSVTYRVEGNTKVQNITGIKATNIALAKGGVVINLKATGSTEVMPGEPVELTVTITNNSSTNYAKVTVSDPLLGEVVKDEPLKGKGGKITKTVTFNVGQTADYAFTITDGKTGSNALNLTSNTVHVIAKDPSKMLRLEVRAEAESNTIREPNATMAFTIRVKNVGEVDGKNLAVKHGSTDIATIESLPVGEETVLTKLLKLTMGNESDHGQEPGFIGKFGFTVSGINAQGATDSIESNTVDIAYLLPTPEPPPPTPKPTPDLTEPTIMPVETDGGETGDGEKKGVGMTLLYIMAGLLVAALAAVVGMILLARRKSAPRDQYYEAVDADAMERGSRRDYAHRSNGRSAYGNTARTPQVTDGEEDPYGDPYENSTLHKLAERYSGQPGDDAEEDYGHPDYSPYQRQNAYDDMTDAEPEAPANRKQAPLGSTQRHQVPPPSVYSTARHARLPDNGQDLDF